MGAVDAAAQDWGASGLAYLTGLPDGPPDFSRAAVLTHARSVAADLGSNIGVQLDAAALLAGRAAQLGLSRGGRVSAGGATRLLRTHSGWCALTLSRPDDVDTLPALLESSTAPDDPWGAVERWAAATSADEAVGRARLLGLPAAVLGEAVAAQPAVRRLGAAAPPRSPAGLLVVDMSSMWAGPLCAQILGWAGAMVVKVESATRPDGTRSGSRSFFDWMNGGKLSYAADFDDTASLRTLLTVADVVITSSRPAALTHRGLGPDDVPAAEGRVWLRITGHGSGDGADLVAFGDDAAVAGGLVGRSDEGPVFCGDAIADPLTGLHGALAVVEALARGGGELVDVAMAAVAANYAALPAHPVETNCVATPPTPPIVALPAADLGADNARVDRIVAERQLASC
ncbi:CoA transferase [Mycobacterium sp. URHB0044]|uniref:CoA transferase n=1 Tax=Mycobacterium sp. URHB0044 TaxID=1380386 RepID=UPI00048AFC60|nr:CoA transferase [Mycobacterium sp. URHB0044]